MEGRFCVLALVACLALPAVASADDDYTACSTAEGNRLAGPHPFLKGQLRDEGAPGYVPFEADAYMNDDETWLCVRVGDVGRRVVLPVASPVTPPTQPVWDTLDNPPVGVSGSCPDGTPTERVSGTIPDTAYHYAFDLYLYDTGAGFCYEFGPNPNIEHQGFSVDATP